MMTYGGIMITDTHETTIVQPVALGSCELVVVAVGGGGGGAGGSYSQGPTGRVFQYQVGSARVLEKIPGSGSGRVG